jgi:hypothetical protein
MPVSAAPMSLTFKIFPGSDPRTTLTCIRNRDRLSKSPGYVIKY